MVKRNITALGLLVLVAGALFVWGLFFLLGDPLWRGGTDVAVLLEDGAGLTRGDNVQLAGVQVGLVREVRLEGPRRVVADVRVNKGTNLPADTRATVRSDVFGAHTVELVPGQALVMLQDGDTIRGLAERALPSMMADLSGQAQAVLASAESLLSPDAVRDVHATAAVLPASAEALRSTFAELQLTARALRRTAEGVEGAEAGPALARTLAELESSARAFTSAAHAMERSLGSLESVLGKIDRGDGTLGRLVNDSTLYGELNSTLREVRALATDMRERPKRYLGISLF